MLGTKTFRGLPFLLAPPIAEKLWLFKIASTSERPHHIFLNFSGRVEGEDHFSEYFWRIENYQLLILDKNTTLIWQSTDIKYKDDGRIVILLSDPQKSLHATLEEQSIIKTKKSASNLESPYEGKDTAALTDSEFLFPTELEITPTYVTRVLIIGSSIAALCHEQLSQQYQDIVFDFVPYEYLAPLPGPENNYDFVYFQPPLRAMIGDAIVWGERFNHPEFAEHIITISESNLNRLIQYINNYTSTYSTPLLVTNFLTPQFPSSIPQNTNNIDLSNIIQILNKSLNNGIMRNKFVKYLDIECLFSSIGKRYVLDDIIYFYSHNGIIFQDWDDFGNFSEDNTPLVKLHTIYPSKYESIGKILFRQMIWGLRTIKKTDCVKAVIFSLDNTLWRGNFSHNSEEGNFSFIRQDGWPMGIWETIHYLRGKNIKTIIYSNGNKEFVQNHWREIIEPHFLSFNDFDYIEIGSSPINETLPDICQKLALRLNDVVIVEAAATRRSEFTNTFPGLRVIGQNPYLTRRILLWAAETQNHVKPTTLLC